jgi:hypothetical protein
MKPPIISELERIAERFEPPLIADGDPPLNPLAESQNYLVGGEWMKPEEMVRRLARRCLELTRHLHDGTSEALP